MNLKIDRSGRIVVPKQLRDRLGLKPNTELEVLEQPGGVLLRIAEQQPTMIDVDGLWVHQGIAEAGANWERVIDDVRDERHQAI